MRELTDRQNMFYALIENMQREDLNSIEEARGMEEMMSAFGLNQEETAKTIGKSLEARVTLTPDADARAELDALAGLDLAELFIVSAVEITDAPGPDARKGENFPRIAVAADAAPGVKCPRCWVHSTAADADGLCPRCAKVVSFLK